MQSQEVLDVHSEGQENPVQNTIPRAYYHSTAGIFPYLNSCTQETEKQVCACMGRAAWLMGPFLRIQHLASSHACQARQVTYTTVIRFEAVGSNEHNRNTVLAWAKGTGATNHASGRHAGIWAGLPDFQWRAEAQIFM